MESLLKEKRNIKLNKVINPDMSVFLFKLIMLAKELDPDFYKYRKLADIEEALEKNPALAKKIMDRLGISQSAA